MNEPANFLFTGAGVGGVGYELTVQTSDTDYHYELVNSLYQLISPYLDIMLTNYLDVLSRISSGKLGYNLFETKLKHRSDKYS